MRDEALFERFSAKLKAKVGPEVYASWFGRLKLHTSSKSVARFTVPTTFLKSWINNRYLDLMTALLQEDAPDIMKVEILVRSAARSTGRTGAAD
ncbi:chromosomal replication initiator protein DnaA, partial [bacterium]